MNAKVHFAIASGAPQTAAAGARVARQGGNSIDVAVASALAATVAETLLASLGGSCFVMLRLAGRQPELIDGADAVPKIPSSFSADSYDWRAVTVPYGDGIVIRAGHASIAVPGTLAALHLAWSRYGSLPWPQIVAPSLELSRVPLPVGKTMAEWLGMAGRLLFAQQRTSRECFVPGGNQPLSEGQTYRLPGLDRTLEEISRHGAETFYRGEVASQICAQLSEGGGLVRLEDLARYQAIVRTPLTIRSAGYQMALNPPPAIGGAAVGSVVRLVEDRWRRSLCPAEYASLQADAQQVLLQLRRNEFAEPDFDQRNADLVLQAQYLSHCAERMNSPNTTHLSVAGADGSLVSITLSIGYGAGVVAEGTGIAFNNSLGEPELNPRGFFAAAPGSRLASNMAPTVAWNDTGALAIGSPGASRITTAIAQTWARFALQGMSLQQAIDAPRLHLEQQAGRFRVLCEPGIDTSLLENRFSVRRYERPNMFFGAPKTAARLADGQLVAIADDRRYGGVELV